MRSSLNHSRTVIDVPRSFKRGEIAGAISAAFGNPIPTSKEPTKTQTIKKKLLMLRARTMGKDTFLTEAEINEIDEAMPMAAQDEIKKEMTYEELINEVESLTNGLQQRDDDLEELRRRIRRCDVSIKNQTNATEGIRKNAKEIESQGKHMMKRFRSYGALPRYYS